MDGAEFLGYETGQDNIHPDFKNECNEWGRQFCGAVMMVILLASLGIVVRRKCVIIE